ELTVATGVPVKVTAVELTVVGPGSKDRGVAEFLRQIETLEGETFDHGVYENRKNAVLAALRERGYFDAELEQRDVQVNRAERTARIVLLWDSGVRYRFGATVFEGSHLDPRVMQRFVTFDEGEPYSARKLIEMQQRMTGSEYFDIVDVSPDIEAATDGGPLSKIVPIAIKVAPNKRTLYTAGVSIGTDSGAGVRGAIDRRYVNALGHKFHAEGQISQRLQGVLAEYRIPRPGRDQRQLAFGAGYAQSEFEDTRSDVFSAAVSDARLWRKWTRIASLKYLRSDFTIGRSPGQSSLLYPELRLLRKETDDILFPRKGWSLDFALRGSPLEFAGGTRFLQFYGDARWIVPIGDEARALFRGALGTTQVRDFTNLPPELRFFAGGDRNIRGFNYQSIGEQDADGAVIGGRHLVAVSAEYEFDVFREWSAAVFVDAGDAFNDRFDAKIAVGVGARWRSPIGLVRLDVGVPVKHGDASDGPQLHLVVGPDL
ncbi:MAG: autotransporter assembly complex family protein, partial [Lysobacterales bacterium]